MAQRALGRQPGLGGGILLGGVLAPVLVPVLTSAQYEVVTTPGVAALPALGGVFGTFAIDDHEAAESFSILAAFFPFILAAKAFKRLWSKRLYLTLISSATSVLFS